MSISRREFIKISGAATGASVASVAGAAQEAPAGKASVVGATTLPYPRKTVVRANTLRENVAITFNYPDESSPCTLIKMGRPTPGGVGPDGDLVAYSTMCTHMGCPVAYDTQSRIFKCPCHFSLFDAEISGQLVCGQATENLPQIVLEYDAASGAITATGVSGKLYGRQSNLL